MVPLGAQLAFNVLHRPSTRDEDLAMTATHADTREALVERLDAQVRELVRRDGVDPQRDALVVRRIAEAVVRDHDERSLTGQVSPVAEPSVVIGELVARVSGFGPLQQFLDDPTVEEIWINDPTRVFIARNGRHELTNLVLTPELVQELTERMLKSSGRRIDISRPFVDAMLPEGHRLHVVLEGISRGFTAVKTAESKPTASVAPCRHAVEWSPRSRRFTRVSAWTEPGRRWACGGRFKRAASRRRRWGGQSLGSTPTTTSPQDPESAALASKTFWPISKLESSMD
jgi:hypothetical protein